jgi:hypothetical protein
VALQLLPGEVEELRIRPSPAAYLRQQLLALGYALWGGILWVLFHGESWQLHEPEWSLPWTWLYGAKSAVAPYAWTLGGLAVGGAAACLPRGPWTRFWWSLAAGFVIVVYVSLYIPDAAPVALPLLTAALSIPGLLWLEIRRLTTHYHFTNLRLVVRRSLPPHEESARYADLVDLDVRPSLFPDTGTLLPILTPAAHADAPVQPRPAVPQAGTKKPKRSSKAEEPIEESEEALEPRRPKAALSMPGVWPLADMKALVQLLVQRATASDFHRRERDLDGQVKAAIAHLRASDKP